MNSEFAPWSELRALDERWVDLLTLFGGTIRRSPDAYVSWLADTRTLIVSPDEELDPDDTIAQIVLHEFCHYLVEGLDSDQSDDWGLDNMSEIHLANEYAALRLQAAILESPLLRTYLNPTTDHRWFYAGLDTDPLRDPVHPATDVRSSELAIRGWENFQRWKLKGRLLNELSLCRELLSRHLDS